MDRVIGQMRVCNVPLNAVNGQVTGQRTAAPIFDNITHHFGTGRLTDQTVVETLVTRHQRFNDLHGAVMGAGFFVGGD